jgi:PD-(D/E)XK nuclease superfamily protein
VYFGKKYFGEFSVQRTNIHGNWHLQGGPPRSWSRFLEIVYKEAIEYELVQIQLNYSREKEYVIPYKEVVLPHNFFADFRSI